MSLVQPEPYEVCKAHIDRWWQLGRIDTDVARDLRATLAPYVEENSDAYLHHRKPKGKLYD